MIEDYNNPLDSGMSGNNVGLTTESLNYLRTAGKWGRFLSMVGLVMIGLFVLMLLFGGGLGLFSMLSGMPSSAGGGAAAFGGIMIVIYLAFLGLGLYVYYLLYQFSTNAILAADNDDSMAATNAFKALARIFTIAGIIMAIYLGFIALFMVFGVLGGLASAF